MKRMTFSSLRLRGRVGWPHKISTNVLAVSNLLALGVSVAACSFGSGQNPEWGRLSDKGSEGSVPELNSQDLAVLLPARNKSEVNRLIGLGATPVERGLTDSGLPEGKGAELPILSRETFDLLVAEPSTQAFLAVHEIDTVPAYEQWRITGIRPIPCARPRAEDSEDDLLNDQRVPPSLARLVSGLQLIDKLSASFSPDLIASRCQLEHRLVAQPFDESGRVADFTIHIINRPFGPGRDASHNLARKILQDISAIRQKHAVKQVQEFNIYPGAISNPEIVADWNAHILRFYGGSFLRTLAFMGSKKDEKWVFFSGPGRNPEGTRAASFRRASLIRPNPSAPAAADAGEDENIDLGPVTNEGDQFQLITLETSADGAQRTVVQTFDGSGQALQPPFGEHYPGLKRVVDERQARESGEVNLSAQSQQEMLDLENLRKFELPNTDCMSCHNVTGMRKAFGVDPQGDGFALGEDGKGIATQAPETGFLQDELGHFINFGYVALRTPSGSFVNRPLVSQHTINHAALSAAFLRKHAGFWFPQPQNEVHPESGQ